ncbi:MAG: Trk system potassium transporter TrkA [marine benthic group bacterium]|nr:Trk system potassium transporter TrkA [Gemmatimonadota bacterium]
MHIVIVGAGEVGYHVAERLSKEQHDVVVVDVDRDRLDYVETHIDVAVVEGSGVNPAVLEQAGIDSAGLLLAVTSIDEVNLVVCMAVPARPDLVKVARVSNPDFYREGDALYPARFGVDVLINPERELAVETFRLLQSTAATDLAVFAGGAVQLIGLTVVEGAPVDGKTLGELDVARQDRSLLAVAVERDGKTIIPDGSTRIQAQDHVYAVATADEIPTALELSGHDQGKLRRVLIAGPSREAYYLARLLEQHGVEGTVLVSDADRARDFAERLDRTLILQGDPTDIELMEFEGAAETDAFVALTEEDEANIISSLVARDLGVRQIITLVNRTDYLPLAKRIGLETAVSPRISAANAILRYVRRGSVNRVAVFKDSDAEVISFKVSADSPLVGRPLEELEFPDHAILASIVRDGEVIIPRGSHSLQNGDEAIVFALADAVGDVTSLFPS